MEKVNNQETGQSRRDTDPLAQSSSSTQQQASPIESKQSITILLEERENHELPRKTQSDSSLEHSQTSLLNLAKRMRRTSSEQLSRSRLDQVNAPDPDLSLPATCSTAGCVLAARCNSSACTIGSAELTVTDSQSSGYTTESSYQTATAGSNYSLSSTSYVSQQRPYPGNYLHEIHVAVEANATDAHVQAIRDDLRNLLCNEVALIHEASGGNRRAIYLIAYQYM
ncbi:uncharacterized protein [Drosophila virilis]|uniref:Uncharacterized protein n=1 Tax=Drosophila virilis TaxID=7244 RepID=B4M930_DROVI|nr:uncharacterized protein LOC6634156 [Drosophila virilis]EDW57706.1 uncharacterized protein Dvir_GJ18237 [Drosophila virilis]